MHVPGMWRKSSLSAWETGSTSSCWRLRADTMGWAQDCCAAASLPGVEPTTFRLQVWRPTARLPRHPDDLIAYDLTTDHCTVRTKMAFTDFDRIHRDGPSFPIDQKDWRKVTFCETVVVQFLPRDASIKRGLSRHAVSVCLSVCLSVTFVHSV